MGVEHIGSLAAVALSRCPRRREEIKGHAEGTPASG